ncbi:helix-turn-helix transcriptional regulator [Microlunatus parietis]|uniref:Putative DNA-binding transcriptional regulator YafY n=1 Tax=Microlunatus parietis TaxID=682979 RepID=A0A7Y9LAZ5_9ACTN|nr:WYL domain-containing protein [Microlunatus parietis]NYE71192.1 putative DNA-binding transcriptional regulator YafY [Microlunatus parietis]
MRADRLVATLLLMQSRGKVTAAEVATELEVSVATARRDLEALSTAGVPVYPQPGRGGGWSLVGGARTDLSGLTETEAQALFLLLGPAASLTPEIRTALRKLTRALPATFRAEAAQAAEAVTVDPAGWGERRRDRPAPVEVLQRAVVRRRRVAFDYQGRERVVDPWGVVAKGDLWYLIAGTERGRRTYRVDRMLDVRLTEEPADRPADFDLTTAWQEVSAELERRRSLVAATIEVDQRLVPVLQRIFGQHCHPDGETEVPAGRARLVVAAHTVRSVAEQLAGFGAAVDVLGPEPVRRELVTIGEELITRNRS